MADDHPYVIPEMDPILRKQIQECNWQIVNVYYELDEQRTKEDAKDVAVYAEVVWCQEEPMNMGGYTYILPRLITSMKAVGRGGYEDVKYAGRAPSAATATGFLKVHLNEQAELVQKAIQREPINFPLLRHSIYIVSPE
ncbi:2-oxoglutarate dehydrogenase, mitochondrial [Glycine soja]|nr:2-oxoglutarate dehydrogenase, mitochondrial [Glycine soja]